MTDPRADPVPTRPEMATTIEAMPSEQRIAELWEAERLRDDTPYEPAPWFVEQASWPVKYEFLLRFARAIWREAMEQSKATDTQHVHVEGTPPQKTTGATESAPTDPNADLDALLAEVARLDKAATEGPWDKSDDDDDGSITHQGAHVASVGMAEDFPCLPDEEYERAEMECLANRSLIAFARTALPRLASALQLQLASSARLAADVGELQRELKAVETAVNRADYRAIMDEPDGGAPTAAEKVANLVESLGKSDAKARYLDKELATVRRALIDEEPELGAMDLGFSALGVVLSDYRVLLGGAIERGEHYDPSSAEECLTDAQRVLDQLRPVVRGWVDAANASAALAASRAAIDAGEEKR